MKSKFKFLSLLSRLAKYKHASGPRLLARLLRDEEGSYLLYMTILIPVFIGFSGLATEGALLFYNHRTVQSAADAAAYSAAIAYSIDNSADITTQAQAIVANYGFVVGTGNDQANVVATVDTTTYSPLTAIDVTITRPQLPILSGIWVSNPFSVGGTAKAIINGGAGGGSGNCMLALAPNGDAMSLQGNPTINAPGCGIFSNSNINVQGNTTITAGALGMVGSVNVTGGAANIGPPPLAYTQGDSSVINPYANITVPAAGACTFTDTQVKNQTLTLQPGTYCTSNPNSKPSIDLQTGAIVTLAAGTYIINEGQFLVDSQATLTGTGVTLVFTDPSGAAYPHASGNGNSPVALNVQSSNVNLQAPTSGAYQGMLIIGDSNIPLDTVFNLKSNSTLTACTSTACINGLIYLPTADFTWSGGPILNSGCTQMIAYRLSMQGNAVFNNTCNISGGGGVAGAQPIGNVVTLVR